MFLIPLFLYCCVNIHPIPAITALKESDYRVIHQLPILAPFRPIQLPHSIFPLLPPPTKLPRGTAIPAATLSPIPFKVNGLTKSNLALRRPTPFTCS